MTKNEAIRILEDGEPVWIYYSHKHVKCTPIHIKDYHADDGRADLMYLAFNWDASPTQPSPVNAYVELDKVFASKNDSIAGYDTTQDVSTGYVYIYPGESQGV